MQLQKQKNAGEVQASTHPNGGYHDTPSEGQAMALLALSHTPVEHQLYQAMFTETVASETRVGSFGMRRLMVLTGLSAKSTIRRGLAGLIEKLSIERYKVVGDGDSQPPASVYYIYNPKEIFARRRANGLPLYTKEIRLDEGDVAFGQAVERIVRRYNLSRREAQVALCCAEGLTNALIADRLHVSGETVKCHLRHIFIKVGVSRRTELISRLLAQNGFI